MMAEKLLKDEYKTPLAMVRGVFLCEDVAVPVSVLTLEITQEAWGTSDATANQDLWLAF
jgi:hypothetical protein